jgi:hypothetical protein
MIGLALMSVALGACGSGTTTNPPATANPTTTVTAQQLGGALLTPSDLGAGWTQSQRDVFATREPENPSIDPSLWCPAGKGDELVTLAGQEGADVELTLGHGGSQAMLRQQAWTNAAVAQYFTSVKAAVDACSGVAWKDSEGNSYSLEPMTAPTIGDESVSWTVTIQLTGTTSTWMLSQQTAARFGTAMMVLQLGATTTGASSSAPNYLLIVRAAGDKMAVAAPTGKS